MADIQPLAAGRFVAQCAAGVMQKHVVERGALHRHAPHRDALRRAPDPSARRAMPGHCRVEMCNRPSCSFTSATSGSFRTCSIQSGGASENSASTTSVASNAVFQVRGRIERGELAVVHDGDAMAQLVGFVHVVRGKQNRQAIVPADFRIISQTFVRETGSRPVVGSSRNRMCGECTSPRAISRRRRMPPENVRTMALANCVRSTASSRRCDQRSAFRSRHAVELRVDQHVFLARSDPDRR